jgi:ComF family protein
LERAIHRFKYEGRRPLERPLAALLEERLALEGLPAAAVVAVPLHPRRLRERGYNQSELLAGRLRRRTGLRRPPGELLRVRDTLPQVGQDRLRRLQNVRGAFRWEGKLLRGMPVIAVDDVTTTGATLDACAVALREAGASSVIGLTLARVGL